MENKKGIVERFVEEQLNYLKGELKRYEERIRTAEEEKTAFQKRLEDTKEQILELESVKIGSKNPITNLENFLNEED